MANAAADQPGPRELLLRLRDAALPHSERVRLILAVEVVPVGGNEAVELQKHLRQFIEAYRDSNDPQDLIAVGSAIRKYVATMDAGELGSVAALLEAGHLAAVPLEIELELTKMVVRKLTANPPQSADPVPVLGDRLMEIARTYLNPRLLPRVKYGATALNAVLALLLLRSGHVTELKELLARLDVSWFKELLARRAEAIRQDFVRRFPEERRAQYLGSVDALLDQRAAQTV